MIVRRIGLVLAAVLSLSALIPALDISPEPDTGRIGALSIVALVLSAGIAIIAIAFFVPAWRGGKVASITIAVAQLASILTALPAFFAPRDLVPPGGVALASIGSLMEVAIFAMIVFDVSAMLLQVAAVIVIVALYAGGVALATAAVPPAADRLVQTTAAIAVALLFQPVLSLLRRTIGRALYGGRVDPAVTTVQIAQHTGRETDAITAAVEDAARALRLPRIQVWDGDLALAASATRGALGSTVVEVPLSSESTVSLRVTLRPGERRLHRDDRAALNLIAVPLSFLIRETALLAELRSARAAVADVREREQQTLHRELHDGIGPALTGALMRADATRNLLETDTELPAAREHLDAARSDLREAVAELRRVVYRLWPLELEQRGLWGAIAARANRSRAVLELPLDPPRLSPAIELACYRIISESLTNVDRHAPGATATVSVLVSEGALHVSVRNDATTATGFVEGMGLASIRARADELGGHAQAGPSPDGWLVHAALPVASYDNSAEPHQASVRWHDS